MNLIQKAVSWIARSIGLTNSELATHAGAAMGYSGETVSTMGALRLSAVWACVNLIAGTVGSLPVMVYRTKGNERETARDHPLYRLLHRAPNADQTPMEWLEFMSACVELHGHAYSEKKFEGSRLIALDVPVNPEAMTRAKTAGGIPVYRWTDRDGRKQEVPEARMLHVRGPLGGLSTLHFGSQVFGNAQAIERAVGGTFRNGIATTGFLKVKDTLDATQRIDLTELLQTKYAGSINAGVPMILDRGMDWQQLSISPEDAQLLEARGFSVEDICRMFGVPPFMIGHTEKTTSWGSGLADMREGFNQFTLRKRLTRIEQALMRSLMTPDDIARGVVIEINVEGLLRGSSGERATFYHNALSDGWMVINEVRRLENMGPVAGGDIPRMQSQNVPINAAPSPAPLPIPAAETVQ